MLALHWENADLSLSRCDGDRYVSRLQSVVAPASIMRTAVTDTDDKRKGKEREGKGKEKEGGVVVVVVVVI